jgi:Ca2+-binding EF-hand superfamily protein
MASRVALDFSEKEIDNLIDEFTKADVDQNGTLDYDEFCKVFAHHLNVC